MKGTRNRLTPFLLIILIFLVWILITIIVYKVIENTNFKKIVKLKLDDDLVQELYLDISDEDIFIYSNKKYNLETLPENYIFSKATSYMTIEDVEFNNNQFKIYNEALCAAVKRAFGPEFKCDLTNLNDSIETDFEFNGHKLLFNIKYAANTNSYIGTYSEITTKDEILVQHELVQATKDGTVDLKIGYIFYKKDTKYQICNDSKCSKIVKELDSLDNIEYDNYITVSLKKASDGIYYYHSNS